MSDRTHLVQVIDKLVLHSTRYNCFLGPVRRSEAFDRYPDTLQGSTDAHEAGADQVWTGKSLAVNCSSEDLAL